MRQKNEQTEPNNMAGASGYPAFQAAIGKPGKHDRKSGELYQVMPDLKGTKLTFSTIWRSKPRSLRMINWRR